MKKTSWLFFAASATFLLEILDIPELQRIFVLNSGAHSFDILIWTGDRIRPEKICGSKPGAYTASWTMDDGFFASMDVRPGIIRVHLSGEQSRPRIDGWRREVKRSK